ncbi:uncharacterized protein LOC126856068 [Cataglyphis hispanica]|uniref:uncharacterized protein LOC126856068 n=1 Tax=Cataglyphis hispanica TaxID=1086592 RepID=UPI00217F4F7D|nr:uncharacterized protein LOC126856068 [Cataglyphis hispanica]
MKNIPYQSLIGSLMYLAVSTRPDISYAISILSQFNTNSGKVHWNAAKRVLRYLKGTKSEIPLIGFVDADCGGNVDDRVFYTGFVFKLANTAITWKARKQKSIALSSTEAEYMALTKAAKETVYLRNLLEEMCYMERQSKPITIYCDNQGAQKLMLNPMYHSRTKHIDIRNHYVRDVFKSGKLDVSYVPTELMIANVLTKSLFKLSHQMHQGIRSEEC